MKGLVVTRYHKALSKSTPTIEVTISFWVAAYDIDTSALHEGNAGYYP
jgi:chemotaxis methyl-accepting protein methylase